MGFMLFFAALMLFYALVLSISLEYIIREGLGAADPVALLNTFLVYYLIFEFLTRYFFQGLPTMELGAYLHLPIRKDRIVSSLLLRSFLSPFNLIAFLLFTPFAMRAVAADNGTAGGLMWLFTIIALSWATHFFILYIKRKYSDSFWSLVWLMVLSLLLMGSDYFGWLQVSSVTAPFFDMAATRPFPLLISIGLLISGFYLSWRHHLQNCYLDELTVSNSSRLSTGNFGMLNRFGKTGSLLNLELQLMLRHKRTRNTLIVCAFFLLYGLLFYPDYEPGSGSVFLLVFLGIFITGIFIMQYGQLLFSWNSGFFDHYLVNPVRFEEFLASKFYLMTGVSFVCYILSIPYVYFGWEILAVNTAMFLYNIGVNTFLVMFMAMWGPQKIDLGKGATFNMEGVGAAQWVMGLPVLIVPMLLYIPFAIIGGLVPAVVFFSLTGIAGFLLRDKIIGMGAEKMRGLKYKIGASFRSE